MPLYNPNFNQAQNNLQTSFNRAQNANSARSRDTAAARVRSRLASQNRGQINSIQNAGTRNMGLQNSYLNQQRNTNMNAQATGVADVEENYRKGETDAATAMGNIATAQGGLQQGIGELGIADVKNKNEATRIGYEGDKVKNDYSLGQEENRIANLKTLETGRANRQKELTDFYKAFAESGATISESDAFNRRFNDLITRLYGSQGLTAGAGDPEDAPVSTPTSPGAGFNKSTDIQIG